MARFGQTAGLALALCAALGVGTPAAALTLGFGCITNNLAGDCTIGEAQLEVEVTAGPGANQVSFKFTNSGPSASSITDVYFDDGTLLGIASIVNGAGVDFAQYASPPDLPGGNSISPPFQVTAGFLADSNPPAQPNGVNPGEMLTIIFDLQGGGVLQDILDELGDGTLRIGIHVQGYSSGGSESFVNVPEPALGLLLALGLLGGGWIRKAR
jgi:hypothetical protein